MTRCSLKMAGVLSGLCLAAATPSVAALKINALFPDTYTGYDYGLGPVVSLSGNAAAQASIGRAASAIANQFSDNVNVNILFYGAHGGDINNATFVGASVHDELISPYVSYVNQLYTDSLLHPNNSVLASAVNNLPSGNGWDNYHHSWVDAALPDLRVLGYPSPYTNPQFDTTGGLSFGSNGWGAGTVDGIVFLNVDLNQVWTRPVPAPEFGYADDAQSTAEHEIDEILGIGGGGSTLNDLLYDPHFAQDWFGLPAGDSLYGPMDLFRYSAPGTPSFTTAFKANAYFSIDGGLTSTEVFNQYFSHFGGDAGDWGIDLNLMCADGFHEGTGHVQDAYGCQNSAPDFTRSSPESIALQAIGYNTVPEPGLWMLMITGCGLVGLASRHRRRRLDSVEDCR